MCIRDSDWEAGWNERLAYPRPLATLFAWQEPWCLAHADRVTAASRWLAAYAVSVRRCSAHQAECRTCSAARHANGWSCPADAQGVPLPNGVDRVSVNSGAATSKPDPPRLLLYTRFVEVTPARIVRVWAQVVRQAPGARLIVVGDQTPGGRFDRPFDVSPAAALQALADAAGLAASIIVLGWTPAAALPGVLAAADVAWIPLAGTAINRSRRSAKLVAFLAAGLPGGAAGREPWCRHRRADGRGRQPAAGPPAGAGATASRRPDRKRAAARSGRARHEQCLSLIHISEPTRPY
mgnify:CR=1 FL=1